MPSRLTGAADVQVLFLGLHQNRQYEEFCRVGIGRKLFLQMAHQPIAEGVRRLGYVSIFRELVVGYCTPASVIESVARGAISVL